jgi:hypothetical protein
MYTFVVQPNTVVDNSAANCMPATIHTGTGTGIVFPFVAWHGTLTAPSDVKSTSFSQAHHHVTATKNYESRRRPEQCWRLLLCWTLNDGERQHLVMGEQQGFALNDEEQVRSNSKSCCSFC